MRILKFLIYIWSCFANEVWWDSGACAWARKISSLHNFCLSTFPGPAPYPLLPFTWTGHWVMLGRRRPTLLSPFTFCWGLGAGLERVGVRCLCLAVLWEAVVALPLPVWQHAGMFGRSAPSSPLVQVSSMSRCEFQRPMGIPRLPWIVMTSQ